MGFREWFDKVSISNKELYYKLIIVFGLFFIVPVTGLVYFAFKYNVVEDSYFAPFMLIFLVFCLIGFRLLRRLFDSIRSISTTFVKTAQEASQSNLTAVADELGSIVQSFRAMEQELKSKVEHLEKKTTEIETLKEMSDLSYMTFNADYLLFIALERSLRLVNADIGSVMILTRPHQDAFVIKASIGLSDHGKKGTITPFEDSIAKHTVINKTPLLVEDIETDTRFGRPSRGRYSTKSFICMPLKTNNEVIGVVTISRKRSDIIFTKTDVDTLTPLLSSAAYIFDNINLFQDVKAISRSLSSLRIVSKAVNSSLQGQEMIQVIFEQMRKNIPFDTIALMTILAGTPGRLAIVDFRSYISTNLSRGRTLTYEGTVLEKAIKEQRNLFIPDITQLSSYIDNKLFAQPGIKTGLVIPLTVEGRITSLLLLFNILEEDWTRLSEIIDVMGDHLSLAIEKERMIDALTKRDSVFDSLNLMCSALTLSAFDMQTTHAHAVEMIRTSIQAEAGYILLVENEELAFAAAFSLDMEKLRSIKIRKGVGIAGFVRDRGTPVIVHDAAEHPNFSPLLDKETGFVTKSILSVPIISQGRITGVMEVLNKTHGSFDESDEKMLQSIATAVSVAMENAQLYQDALQTTRKVQPA
jgi:GAF domain-containing protein/HAMP domain-containing protein